jgi:hypothetical protein
MFNLVKREISVGTTRPLDIYHSHLSRWMRVLLTAINYRRRIATAINTRPKKHRCLIKRETIVSLVIIISCHAVIIIVSHYLFVIMTKYYRLHLRDINTGIVDYYCNTATAARVSFPTFLFHVSHATPSFQAAKMNDITLFW